MSDQSLTVNAYRGRFAPSPTGPLHLGSVVTAVGSYLQARRAGGEWRVRIEDIELTRSVPGMGDRILRTLENLGFTWDGPVMLQSQRRAAYQQALQTLINADLAYACTCTRSELQVLTNHPARSEELPYPGLCARGPLRSHGPYGWRLRVPDEPVSFEDGLQGAITLHLPQAIGDFIIKRRDGWFAYQLAVVVDDAEQGITDVVRGHDLLLNTPRQITLQRALGLPVPRHMHLPLAVDNNGNKLAKSTGAAAIDSQPPAQVLWRALQLLRQAPPVELQQGAVAPLWQWALAHWQVNRLAGISAVSCQ